jgi:O-antigen/teichoic acid export membrane protein
MKLATLKSYSIPKKIGPEQLFMISILIVNAGNYIYNLLLGRILGPAAFSDAAILITFLLILSFIGMTFQIVTAKYAVLFENEKLQLYLKILFKYATIIGFIFGGLVIVFSSNLQTIFHTQSSTMFTVFGFGLPLYFLMSVNRGYFQGKNLLNKLSFTYQSEMIGRLTFTLIPILLFPQLPTSVLIAIGIVLSFIVGLFPFQKTLLKNRAISLNTSLDAKPILLFFGLTVFYEFTQIIINNSDIILVKHFFNNEQAGLYASLALIGRVVYFIAWMFVMLLLPKVIQLKKEGKQTQHLLIKYVSYVVLLSIIIVTSSKLFPRLIVQLMFGEQYLAIAPLLWKYALATSIFAVANIFAYYFLSINQYIPVIGSAILGMSQIVLIIFFHNNLEQVVFMQIIAMVLLLIFQLSYFFYQHN